MPAVKTEMEKRDVLRMSNEESKRLTKECLQTALIYLMAEKPFDRITITELVRRSGVSRTAFYRNYTCKEDILSELSDDITSAISKSLTGEEYALDPQKWYVAFLGEIKKNSKLFGLLLQTNMIDGIFDRIRIAVREAYSGSADMKYRFEAVIGAQISIFIEWFKSGMTESEDYIAGLCVKIRDALC